MLDKGQNTTGSAAPRGPERVGRYELVARLGDGLLAEVHLAREVGTASSPGTLVVKKIHSHLARDKELIGVLFDEVRASALIKHPRVIDIYDVGVSDGIYFIAMEYLAGQPLGSLVARAAGGVGSAAGPQLDVYATARIIADVADGLHAAHNLRTVSGRPLELVHRDVSPQNILLLYDGNVKLVDFAVARACALIGAGDRGGGMANEHRREGGTVGYASPEQLTGGVVDRRSDVFSLGVVMWEALVLRPLFDADDEADRAKQTMRGQVKPPSSYRPEVPSELDRICLRALALEPEERFQSAGNMQTAIESFLRDAGFRREAGGLSRFMNEAFAAEREAQELLVKRAREPEPDAETVARTPTEATGATMARGSQHMKLSELALPATAVPSSEPGQLVPRPPPDRSESRRPSVPDDGSDGEPRPAEADTASPRDASGSTSVPRPRGKGRTGRFDSLADAWNDRPGAQSSRSLPLPPPPSQGGEPPAAEQAAARPASRLGDDDEDDEDVTIADENKSPRPFVPPSATAADEPEKSYPFAIAKPLRGLWLVACVAVAATALMAALLLPALGGGDQAATAGDDPLAGAGALLQQSDRPGNQGPAAPAPAMGASAPGPVSSAPSDPVSDAKPSAASGETGGSDAVSDVKPSRSPASGEASGQVSDSGTGPESGPESSVSKAKSRAPSSSSRRGSAAARKAARRVAAPNPTNLYREGVRFYLNDKLDVARRRFQSAVEAAPRFAPPYRGLGLVHERAGNKTAAIRAFQSYLRLAPDALDAEVIRARIERLRSE